jgi:hypothetical protein
VVAADEATVDDAADQVVVDYEPLPTVTNMTGALAPGAPLVDDTLPDNLVSHQSFSVGAPNAQFATAYRVVEAEFAQHRQSHVPMEPRGCVAIWDTGREHLTMYVGNRVPHPYRTQFATTGSRWGRQTSMTRLATSAANPQADPPPTPPPIPATNVLRQIAQLRDTPTGDLKQRWRELFGKNPPAVQPIISPKSTSSSDSRAILWRSQI